MTNTPALKGRISSDHAGRNPPLQGEVELPLRGERTDSGVSRSRDPNHPHRAIHTASSHETPKTIRSGQNRLSFSGSIATPRPGDVGIVNSPLSSSRNGSHVISSM